MRIPKGGTPLPPSPRASRRRAHKFNKTTERKSLQRKTSSFYEKRRFDFDPKVDNDSQITNLNLQIVDIYHFRFNLNSESAPYVDLDCVC